MRLFSFGYGYSAEALARKLSPRLDEVAGTRTRPERPTEAGAPLLPSRPALVPERAEVPSGFLAEPERRGLRSRAPAADRRERQRRPHRPHCPQ